MPAACYQLSKVARKFPCILAKQNSACFKIAANRKHDKQTPNLIKTGK